MDLIRLFVSEQVCPTEVNDTAIAEMATVIRATALIVNTPRFHYLLVISVSIWPQQVQADVAATITIARNSKRDFIHWLDFDCHEFQNQQVRCPKTILGSMYATHHPRNWYSEGRRHRHRKCRPWHHF